MSCCFELFSTVASVDTVTVTVFPTKVHYKGLKHSAVKCTSCLALASPHHRNKCNLPTVLVVVRHIFCRSENAWSEHLNIGTLPPSLYPPPSPRDPLPLASPSLPPIHNTPYDSGFCGRSAPSKQKANCLPGLKRLTFPEEDNLA